MDVLILEDAKYRISSFREMLDFVPVIVSTAEDAIRELSHKDTWHYIFLDHDLGNEIYVDSSRKDCGMEVVRWLMKNQIDTFAVVCHSHNEYARKEMVQTLSAKYRVKDEPFLTLSRDSDSIRVLNVMNKTEQDIQNYLISIRDGVK